MQPAYYNYYVLMCTCIDVHVNLIIHVHIISLHFSTHDIILIQDTHAWTDTVY